MNVLIIDGRCSGIANYNQTGGIPAPKSITGLEGATKMRINIDASTVVAGDNFYVYLTYFTEA